MAQNILLVQACRLYLEKGYMHAGFKTLLYFTYKVTMAYLHFVEKSDKNELCNILPHKSNANNRSWSLIAESNMYKWGCWGLHAVWKGIFQDDKRESRAK